MKMIRHQHEFMQEIRFAALRQKRVEKEPRPRFRAEESTPFPRVRRDKIGLRIVGCVLACGFQDLPSAAKAATSFASVAARLKSCPFKATTAGADHQDFLNVISAWHVFVFLSAWCLFGPNDSLQHCIGQLQVAPRFHFWNQSEYRWRVRAEFWLGHRLLAVIHEPLER